MIKKIIKGCFIYSIFYILSKTLFSLFFFSYRADESIDIYTFIFYQLLDKKVFNISVDIGVTCMLLIQRAFEASCFAVLTSYIFVYILNREPQIVFPDKLVIRHRTSWEAKNKITLGILIGNKSYYNIHNVKCSITCSYIKQEEPLLINSEFTLSEERILLENYFRFSFDLSKFPRKVLKDIINKPTYCDKETIVVSIVGNSNYLGNIFKVSHKYKLTDIVYDEHTPIISYPIINPITKEKIKNPFSHNDIKKIKWTEIKDIVEADEEKRKKSVKEIKFIIKNKEK